ncbi:MAG: methyltransferase domain-containing protein [Actinophytocola sp.]|nr:methyltransferase domain-containing protein [Actinophytocola sp.]
MHVHQHHGDAVQLGQAQQHLPNVVHAELGEEVQVQRVRVRERVLVRDRAVQRELLQRVEVDVVVAAGAQSVPAAGVDDHVQFRNGRVEALPAPDGAVDCVISNGVINLIPDKTAVFREVARVLRPGGRLAIADIVTERQLASSIVCNVDLWASCIGGAAQESAYRQAIEDAGLRVEQVRANPYEFLSDGARGATTTYGVKSISLLATK